MADEFVPIPVRPSDPEAFVPKPVGEDQQFWDGTAVGEVLEGVISGGIGAVEGVAGVLALTSDLAFGTEYADDVTAAAEAVRDTFGIDPEGILGKGAELVTQFIVPGAAAARGVALADRAARAARGLTNVRRTGAEKWALAGKELAAAGVTDALVSTDNMTTIGDWVDFGPTQTSDLIGLSGRERALARLGNRLKIGAEATLLGGVAQGALTAAGRTIGQSRIGQVTARAASEKLNELGQNIDNLLERRMFAAPGSAEELSGFKAKLADAIAFSRPGGFLPESIATTRELLDGQVQIQTKKADRILKQFDEEVGKFIKQTPEGQGNLDRAGIMSRLESFLTEKDPVLKRQELNQLPKNVRQSALRMRNHIDALSNDVLNSNYLKERKFTIDGRDISDVINQNINSYLRRRYRIFEDAKYVPTEESVKAADDFFRTNKRATERNLTQLARRDVFGELSDDFLSKNGLTRVGVGENVRIEVGGKITDAAAQKARENFLSQYSIRAREKLSGGRVARDRLETGMFVAREEIPKVLRQLMGEIDDPMEAYLGTIADLAQFTAVDDYFGSIARMADQNSGIGKMFINGNTLTPAQEAGLRERGFVKLGGEGGVSSGVQVAGREAEAAEKLIGSSGWGSLENYYVPMPVYKNLSNLVLAEDTIGTNILRGLFGTFLKAKGISQYSKTVLSPITQVRNFITASTFALANGNIPAIGRGSTLLDSGQAIFANITNRGSDALFDDLADAQRRGVLGTNAELREIQDNLNKGLGITGREPRSFIDAIAGTGGGAREKLARSVGKATKPFEAAYQGSDDFWKYFSYNAEQAQLRHALQNVSVEDQIAYLSKGMDDVEINRLMQQARGTKGEPVNMVDELIRNRAAQIVRDTVPNYNKASSDLVRLGRRLPVGNFISFPAEIYRTGFNIVKQGLDDMASDIPGIQARGRNRLLGFVTTTTVLPAAALELGFAVSGVSREEMDAYKRSFAPPWEKGALLIPVGKTEDGKIEYINASTLNPYDVLSRFANRAINETDDAIREGKDFSQVLTDVALGTLGEVFEPFFSEAMLTEALVDVSLRGGRTATGAEVFNPQDNAFTKGFKRILHVADALTPNLVPFNVSAGRVEPSRFLRGVFGSEDGLISSVDKMGRERNPIEELKRQLTGVSVLEFDPNRALEYGAYRMSQAQTDAKRMFNRVTDDVNASSQDLFNAYVAANEAKLRVDREYYQMIEDLRAMNFSDRDIDQTLRENNIGGRDILFGEFEPFEISRRNIEEMRRAGILDRLPDEAIRNYGNQMFGLPLAPDQGPRISTPPTPSFTPAPAFTPRPVQPQQPVFTPRPVQRGAVDPALLGDNPVEQAANAAIAQRTGRV